MYNDEQKRWKSKSHNGTDPSLTCSTTTQGLQTCLMHCQSIIACDSTQKHAKGLLCVLTCWPAHHLLGEHVHVYLDTILSKLGVPVSLLMLWHSSVSERAFKVLCNSWDCRDKAALRTCDQFGQMVEQQDGRCHMASAVPLCGSVHSGAIQ